MTTTKAKKTYRKCTRCNGTGVWAAGSKVHRGGVCFGCNGYGQRLNWTKALEIEAKVSHIAEVKDIVAKAEIRKAEKLAAHGTSWRGWHAQDEARLAGDRANLARLEAELAALEAS